MLNVYPVNLTISIVLVYRLPEGPTYLFQWISGAYLALGAQLQELSLSKHSDHGAPGPSYPVPDTQGDGNFRLGII